MGGRYIGMRLAGVILRHNGVHILLVDRDFFRLVMEGRMVSNKEGQKGV
jgi:hypothetical protein